MRNPRNTRNNWKWNIIGFFAEITLVFEKYPNEFLRRRMKQKKVIIDRPGGVEALRIAEADIPTPGKKEVRIRISTAGVAFADIMMRSGKYPGRLRYPLTPGYDVCGSIDACGEGVDSPEIGSKVVAFTRVGGYAQYVCTPSERAFKIPMDISDGEAVCLVLNYLSAYQMMYRVAGIEKGGCALVHSAAGGVGTALLQLGKLIGLRMYGTASKEKHHVVQICGGIPIDYRAYDFEQVIRELEPGGVDAIFDPVAGSHWLRSMRVLSKGGILVGYGVLSLFQKGEFIGSYLNVAAQMIKLKLFHLKRHFAFYGIDVKRHPDWYREDLENIFSYYLKGLIRPVVACILPLSDVRTAHTLLERGKVAGKIVLDCS